MTPTPVRFHWSLYFLAWLGGTVGAGALLGAALFPVFGPWFGSEQPTAQLALAGARSLGFMAFIWAPALALVLTVKREYTRRHPPAGEPLTPGGR